MNPYTPRSQKSTAATPFLMTRIAIFAVLIFGFNLSFSSASTIPVIKATVVLSGNSTVTGSVVFEQASPDGPVKISGEIKGFSPNALRGFHVHQSGNLTGGCVSAGPHFNPYGKVHGAPTDVTRHVGDLGNIETNESGVANIILWDSLISLNGANSIVGRSIVVHAGTDDLGRGDNEESLKTGNAGARAACGVIGLA